MASTDTPREDFDNVVGLTEAAALAGVAHQTIRNWAKNGILHTGRKKDILAAMNARKSGRKYTRYYYRDEVEALAGVEVTDDLISVDEAAETLGVTRRSVTRIRAKHRLPSFTGPGHIAYLRRADVEKYREEHPPQETTHDAAESK